MMAAMSSASGPSAAPSPATPVAAETPPLSLGPVDPSHSYRQVGYVFAAVGALLFSTKGIAIKLAYREAVDAETLLALRMGLSLPIYAAIGLLAVRDRRKRGAALPTRALVVKAALVGALGYWVASYTDFLGLEYISAQFERLILFTYPLFVVILGALFFGQPMKLRSLGAIGLSYIGLALIFTEKFSEVGAHVALGAGFVLVAAVTFALYQLLAKGVITAMGPRLFTCIAMSGAAAGSFIEFGITHPIADLAVSQHVWAISVFIAIGATVLPSFFLNAALHRISAAANATIGTLSPVMTIALAVVILGENLTLTGVAGTALVLAGVGWFTLADRARS
jgi:drug/metabolite transporter (DMT)-like permease